MLIKPSTALAEDYDAISNMARETGQPIYITKEGEGDVIVMNIDAYEREKQLAALRGAIDRAENERLNGEPCMTGEEIRTWLKERIHAV